MRKKADIILYHVNHVRHGCYEVILQTNEERMYLTNFRNKKAAQKFIEAHEKGEVTIDPETCVPAPDFK